VPLSSPPPTKIAAVQPRQYSNAPEVPGITHEYPSTYGIVWLRASLFFLSGWILELTKLKSKSEPQFIWMKSSLSESHSKLEIGLGSRINLDEDLIVDF
jgi:hypothetical protein